MDLDADAAQMTEEDAQSFRAQRRRVVGAIEAGNLVINENGEPVLTVESVEVDGGKITFYEPTGAALMASDGKKKDDRMRQMYSIMGAMTKQHANVFAKMKRRELKICEAVAVLFLA